MQVGIGEWVVASGNQELGIGKFIVQGSLLESDKWLVGEMQVDR